MVEIALAVAIIAFALVAIIGVLPAGLQVQKENREDTLMVQDGSYFMEALRNGAQGAYDLTNYIERVTINGGNPTVNGTLYPTAPGPKFFEAWEAIGLLSTPGFTNTAVVRSISGAISEKGPATADLSFRYQLQVRVLPFEPNLLPAEVPSRVDLELGTRLHEIRLAFRWPFLGNGNLGNGRQVLRSLVSGDLHERTSNNVFYYFLRP